MVQLHAGKPITDLVETFYPNLDSYGKLYRQIHHNPELSHQEAETAQVIADRLRQLDGFEVKTGIGGHGIVGILRNGPGQTILFRAELDALPVLEQTGLPFASTKTMYSQTTHHEEPVMHACGHDLHMCVQLAACELLSSSRRHWRGTVVAVFQPAEETGDGAKTMVDDGLYEVDRHNVPVPDVALGGHCMPYRAGVVKVLPGVVNSSADILRVTLYGHGGHGSRPHTTVDPVVLACSVVMKLQTIVSRCVNPMETVVITVGSIHSGTVGNVIPDNAILQLCIRTFSEDMREHVLDLTSEFIRGEASMWGCPIPPLIETLATAPTVDNDEVQTKLVMQSFKEHFGEAFELDTPSPGSEDFTYLIGNYPIPIVFWTYGSIDPDTWDKAVQDHTTNSIPANHSSRFKPAFDIAIRAGLESYAVAALTYLL